MEKFFYANILQKICYQLVHKLLNYLSVIWAQPNIYLEAAVTLLSRIKK